MSDLYAIMKPLKKQTSSLLARLLPTGSQPGGSRRRAARRKRLREVSTGKSNDRQIQEDIRQDR